MKSPLDNIMERKGHRQIQDVHTECQHLYRHVIVYGFNCVHTEPLVGVSEVGPGCSLDA